MEKKHYIGFNHAWGGIKYAFLTQKNFLVHLTLGSIAVTTGILLRIPVTQVLLLILLFILGLVIEMVNTSIESVVDLVTDEWRENAKLAKDISSGAMLIFAFGASIMAGLILFPPFLNLFK